MRLPPKFQKILRGLDREEGEALLDHVKGGTPAPTITAILAANGIGIGVTTIKEARKVLKHE